jgi:hypothetical protein
MTVATMGDLRGRRARWTAAAVLAPVAAAVFAGTTAWANSHDPNAAVAPTAAARKPTHTVDPVLRKLRQQVERQSREVAHMRANVKTLHRRAKTIANTPVSSGSSSYTYSGSSGSSGYSGSSGGTTYSSGGSTSSGSSGGSTGGSSGGTTTTPAAPPPPTPHTSTGASTPP